MVAKSGVIGLALSLGLIFRAEAGPIEVELESVLTWINTPSGELWDAV